MNNKTESIHEVVVNVFLLVPKRSYYCSTICGKARTYLAVSIDSLGYYGYYTRLCVEMGTTMTPMTATFYKPLDKKRAADKILQQSPEFRKKRAKRKLENMSREWQREVIDKQAGNTYSLRIVAPNMTEEETATTGVADAKVMLAEPDITI